MADKVYTGANRITVNPGTMKRIVSEWLHNYHTGGPYKVTDVTQDDDNDNFHIDFEDVPTPAESNCTPT